MIYSSSSSTIRFGFTGQVVDEKGNPIEDVQIKMAGSKLKRTSNYDGSFRFYTNGYKGTPKLTFSKEGYIKKIVKAKLTGTNWFNITPSIPIVILEKE